MTRIRRVAGFPQERRASIETAVLLGEIAARESPLDIGKAENHYRQALALAEELGMRPSLLIAMLVWANCTGGQGTDNKLKSISLLRRQ